MGSHHYSIQMASTTTNSFKALSLKQSQSGDSSQNIHSKDGEEPSAPRVRLMGQPTSSQWQPPVAITWYCQVFWFFFFFVHSNKLQWYLIMGLIFIQFVSIDWMSFHVLICLPFDEIFIQVFCLAYLGCLCVLLICKDSFYIHFFPHMDFQCFSTICWKNFSRWIDLVDTLVKNQLVLYVWIYYWTLYFVSLIYLSDVNTTLFWL